MQNVISDLCVVSGSIWEMHRDMYTMISDSVLPSTSLLPNDCVKDLYSNLDIYVQSSRWKNKLDSVFQTGVFGQRPLFMAIFRMVINLYGDVITQPS